MTLRHNGRYCRKKRVQRVKRRAENISIVSEEEKEERAKKKLRSLLHKREEQKYRRREKCPSVDDMFGGRSLSLGGISLTLGGQGEGSGVIVSSTLPEALGGNVI